MEVVIRVITTRAPTFLYMAKAKRQSSKGKAIRFLSWESQRSFKRGEKPSEKSPGVVVVIFSRAFPRYSYTLNRKMTLATFKRWQKGSLGKIWNNSIKGKY